MDFLHTRKSAKKGLFEPFRELMADWVRASHVVGADDTIMPMLSTGKAADAGCGAVHLTVIRPQPTRSSASQ